MTGRGSIGQGKMLKSFVCCLLCYLKELENGRLFRLITKLGVINERPEYVLYSRKFLDINIFGKYNENRISEIEFQNLVSLLQILPHYKYW